MSFLSPAAFALGLLLPVIVAFYLLKLRRTEREVSSVYLWRKMVRDVEANAPWQRLRRNLLLILQLLFLAALILAAARPFTWSEGVSGQSAIFILDTSASMAATDVQPTRLEAAKERARQMVDELPDTARVTVIEAGDKARVDLASSQDRRQAHQAIQSVQVSTGSSDLAVALELASAIAARQPDTEIVVFSDGRVELPQRLAIKGRLRYLPMGLSGENQAISLMTLKPGSGGGSLTAFVQVSNYGSSEAKRRLSLFSGEHLINAYDLTLPPGGQQAVLAEDLPIDTEWVEARLEGEDALPLDDHAVAVREAVRRARVALVSNGNLFLTTALKLLPGVEVVETLPDAEIPTDVDLTIYDGQVPEPEKIPEGSLLFIAPPASTSFFSVTGQVKESPILRPVDPNDPLLRNVSLAGVSVMDAVQVSMPERATPVIAGDTGSGSVPLLFHGPAGERRVAVLAFDLHHSDLPLQPAFPLLWVNLIDWLAPGAGGEIPPEVAPGQSLTLTLPAEVETLSVTRPDGSTVKTQVDAGKAVLSDTNQLGRYSLSWGEDGSASFAVNLFSPQESNLSPVDALPGLEAQQAQGAADQAARREWWRPLGLLALGLLSGEWLVYQRAAVARVVDSVKKSWRKKT